MFHKKGFGSNGFLLLEKRKQNAKALNIPHQSLTSLMVYHISCVWVCKNVVYFMQYVTLWLPYISYQYLYLMFPFYFLNVIYFLFLSHFFILCRLQLNVFLLNHFLPIGLNKFTMCLKLFGSTANFLLEKVSLCIYPMSWNSNVWVWYGNILLEYSVYVSIKYTYCHRNSDKFHILLIWI